MPSEYTVGDYVELVADPTIEQSAYQINNICNGVVKCTAVIQRGKVIPPLTYSFTFGDIKKAGRWVAIKLNKIKIESLEEEIKALESGLETISKRLNWVKLHKSNEHAIAKAILKRLAAKGDSSEDDKVDLIASLLSGGVQIKGL